MLDRSILAHMINQLPKTSGKNNIDLSWLTQSLWKEITEQESFLEAIEQKRKAQAFADWSEPFGTIHTVQSQPASDYSILAVDGSQIYPDKHQGDLDLFLLNTGSCFIRYGKQSAVQMNTQPHLVPERTYRFLKNVSPIEIVDLIREEKEFDLAIQKAGELNPTLTLFDGNLLLWHMEQKSRALKDHFMPKYLAPLLTFYEQQRLVAGYLSAPRFHDIATLLTVGLSGHNNVLARFVDQALFCQMLEELTDTDLFAQLLQPRQRSIIFTTNHPITNYYSFAIKPCFLYLNTGSEIVRIEIPAWLACNKSLVDEICSLCIDQCDKGQGYPVVLAEAHAQAVIHQQDKAFFYHMMSQHVENASFKQSFKSMKKRMLNV